MPLGRMLAKRRPSVQVSRGLLSPHTPTFKNLKRPLWPHTPTTELPPHLRPCRVHLRVDGRVRPSADGRSDGVHAPWPPALLAAGGRVGPCRCRCAGFASGSSGWLLLCPLARRLAMHTASSMAAAFLVAALALVGGSTLPTCYQPYQPAPTLPTVTNLLPTLPTSQCPRDVPVVA